MALTKQDRPVQEFTEIELRGIGRVILTQGEGHALSVETDEEVLPYIRTEVVGDRLVLDVRNPSPIGILDCVMRWLERPHLDITYRVTAARLEGLHIAGAGKIRADQVHAQSLELTISGSGKITLSGGSADFLEARISGAGTIDTHALIAREADVHIAGAGSVSLYAEDALDVQISGAGSVRFDGHPRLFKRIAGVGTVKPLHWDAAPGRDTVRV